MNGFILHLQGPMMSFGDTGFGQLRGAGEFPSRSAVIGVIAAAMGIERGDESLLTLHRALRVHVATVSAGRQELDYHTISTAGYAEYDPARLRRGGILGTNPVLTYRTYHHDAQFVALVEGDDPVFIETCRSALRNPVFTGYLGRRSCPPAVPLLPKEISGDSITKGLTDAVVKAHTKREQKRPSWIHNIPKEFVAYLDGNVPLENGMEHLLSSYRRDLLTALPRSYVNRQVRHVRIMLPGTVTNTALTNEESSDAAP